MSKKRKILEWLLCVHFFIVAASFIMISMPVAIITIALAIIMCPVHDMWICRIAGRPGTYMREALAFIVMLAAVAMMPATSKLF